MKTYRMLLLMMLFSCVIIIGVALLLWHFQKQIEIQELERRLDKAMEMVMERAEDEKRLALSMAHFLAQDSRLHAMLQEQERMKAFHLLQTYLDSVGSLLQHPVEVQVHTQELHTFIRSWNFQAYDIPLASFRKGLVRVRDTQKPYVSIELGKRLNIKAIAPMIEEGEFIGSVETIIGLEALQQQLREYGVAVAMLLDEKYLDVATGLREQQKISGHVIANNDCQRACMETLQRAFRGGWVREGAYLLPRYALGVTPFFDSQGEQLGFWVVIIAKESSDNTPHWTTSEQEWVHPVLSKQEGVKIR